MQIREEQWQVEAWGCLGRGVMIDLIGLFAVRVSFELRHWEL